MAYDHLTIISGRAHPDLAKEIADYLGIKLAAIEIGDFPDGEISVKLNQNIRGCDVFIVQPTGPPVNRNIMELLILIDACRRASAARITAVLPYFGYARQDRKDSGRVPITAKLVANPDEGSIKRALQHLERLGGNLAIVDKRRSSAMNTQQVNLIGGPIRGK